MNDVATPPIRARPHQPWDEVYGWELREVYLLLDFIAGRPDKNLASLEVEVSDEVPDPDHPEKTIVVTRKARAPEITRRISAMRIPPPEMQPQRSREAALLLSVKDQLCYLAYPATALSIAFTDLVAANGRRRTWLERLSGLRGQGQASPPPPDDWSRISVGRRLYPHLEASARSFQRQRTWVLGVTVTFAVVSAVLLAVASYGGQLTSRLQGARRDEAAAAAKIYDAFRTQVKPPAALADPDHPQAVTRVAAICPLSQAAKTGAGIKAAEGPGLAPGRAPTQDPGLPGNTDTRFVQLCDDYAFAAASLKNAIEDVDAYARHLIPRLMTHVLPIHELPARPQDCGALKSAAERPAGREQPGPDPDDCAGRQETGPSVAGMVSAFANYVLPLCFGVVGVLSGIIRGVQDRIIDSVLVPRDRPLLWLRIVLGLVAGASVGLFFDPSKVAAEITSGNSGLSVSASGLAFLAGYGAPAFFRLLDNLLTRVFDFRDERGPVTDPSRGRPA